MMIHLVTLETHVTFEAGESILSLKMKEMKKRELSVLLSIKETKVMRSSEMVHI